jgi:hypothetical protein
MNEEIYSLRASRDNYKRLYEKERATKDGKPVLRDTDKTRLLALRDFINELLERWEDG